MQFINVRLQPRLVVGDQFDRAAHERLGALRHILERVHERGNVRQHLGQVAVHVRHGGVEIVEQLVRVLEKRAGGGRDLLDAVGRMALDERVVHERPAASGACGKCDEFLPENRVRTERRDGIGGQRRDGLINLDLHAHRAPLVR